MQIREPSATGTQPGAASDLIHSDDVVQDGGGDLGPVITRPRWATLNNLERLLLAAPIGLVLLLGYTHRWTFEEGFGYFRVVDQILAGNGPVFNAGERVESFASPLWLALLTFADVVSPLRLEYTAVALSLALTGVALVLATVASARLLDIDSPGRRIRLPLGLVVFAALWPVWVWSTGGTEVAMTLAWLAVCFFIMTRWAIRPRESGLPPIARWELVVLGLGWLVRPELLVSSVLFAGVVVVFSATTTRRRWGMIATAAAMPVAYQVFRMGYYGLVTSSASMAREDMVPRPGFGWDYFADFVSPYLIAVPVVALLLTVYVPMVGQLASTGDRRRLVVVAVTAGSGVAHAVIVMVIVGGDAVHGRLLLPSLFALLAPVFVVPGTRRYLQALVVTAVWGTCCGVLMRPPDDGGSRPFTNGYPGPGLTYEDTGFESRGRQPWIDEPGLYVADTFAPTGERVPFELTDPDEIVVASKAPGVIGYVLGPDIDVLDLNGFSDPLIAHQRLEFRLIPGREKTAFGPWLVARFAESPEAVLPEDLELELPFMPPTPPLEYLEQVAWAEASLECEPLARLQDAYRESLTPSRFLTNVWNAMTNTSLRFDPYPEDAFRGERCARTIPANVLAFYERVGVDGTLPSESGRGEVRTAGRCDVVFVATGNEDDAWVPVEGRTHAVTVEIDAESTESALAALFVMGPPGSDGAVVWISTDGAGNYQIIQNVIWFPPIASPWIPIDPDTPIEVSIVPNLDGQTWVTMVDGLVVADYPMYSEAPGDEKDLAGEPIDGDLLAVVPRWAAPGSDTMSIEHHQYRVSDVCQSILAQHPSPPLASSGRIDRYVPSIT